MKKIGKENYKTIEKQEEKHKIKDFYLKHKKKTLKPSRLVFNIYFQQFLFDFRLIAWSHATSLISNIIDVIILRNATLFTQSTYDLN